MREPALVTRPVSAASEHCKHQCFPQDLVEQLVSICRSMFPHSAVPDEFYEHVVRKLDDQVAHDQNLSGLLFNGVDSRLALGSGLELDTPKHSVHESSFRDSDSWLPFHPGLSARIAA